MYISLYMETRFLCDQDFALQYTIMLFNVGVGTSDQIRLQTCRICIVCQFSGVFFFFFFFFDTLYLFGKKKGVYSHWNDLKSVFMKLFSNMGFSLLTLLHSKLQNSLDCSECNRSKYPKNLDPL